MIRLTCPVCQSKLNAKEGLAGQTRKCPKCGNPLVIPATEDPPKSRGSSSWMSRYRRRPRRPPPLKRSIHSPHFRTLRRWSGSTDRIAIWSVTARVSSPPGKTMGRAGC